jgi:hypothetical protein
MFNWNESLEMPVSHMGIVVDNIHNFVDSKVFHVGHHGNICIGTFEYLNCCMSVSVFDSVLSSI